VSGTIADHGMAVMLARGDLALEADLRSDTAPVSELVELLLAAAPSTRWLRDPTRGGVATVCNELARATDLAIVLEERLLPVRAEVSGACDLLGIDPLYVANEGKFVAVVAPDETDAALAALRSHPLGEEATAIGEIRDDPPGPRLLVGPGRLRPQRQQRRPDRGPGPGAGDRRAVPAPGRLTAPVGQGQRGGDHGRPAGRGQRRLRHCGEHQA
jgi:hydrogenase maturation factor